MDEFALKLAVFKTMAEKISGMKGDPASRNAVFLHEMCRVIEFFLGRITHFKDQYKKL